MLGAIALFAVGCTDASQESASASSSEINARSSGDVVPGSFRLFEEAGHVSNPECEVFTKLELTADGVARLAGGFEGRCTLMRMGDANERSYSLTRIDTACGGKVYKGVRRSGVDALATITITDNRAMSCYVPAQAQIVVEEARPSAQSEPTTLYSADRVETLAIECSATDDEGRGAHVRFYRSPNAHGIARAVYTETTRTASQVVADMNVCVAYPHEEGADKIERTFGCNDVSWVDGFSVELYEGGLSGAPSVKLHKADEDGVPQLFRELDCSYVTP